MPRPEADAVEGGGKAHAGQEPAWLRGYFERHWTPGREKDSLRVRSVVVPPCMPRLVAAMARYADEMAASAADAQPDVVGGA